LPRLGPSRTGWLVNWLVPSQLPANPERIAPHKHRGLLPFLGMACGASVATIYYNQPLLLEMSRTFHASSGQIGWVAVATQMGYAVGVLAFVPMGDVAERRGLIVKLFAAVSVALLAAGVAPTLWALVAASVAIGMTAAVTHVVVPIAPELVEPRESGRAIGTVMTGLLLGILLGRTASGWLATALGWRGVFLAASAFTALFVPLLRWGLPRMPPVKAVPYREALASLWKLTIEQPVLREASAVGFLVFAAFSSFWTNLAFLLGTPHYRLGAGVAGSFGVLGAAGALVASFAGRMADRRGPRWVVAMGVGLFCASYVVLWIAGYHMAGLIVGVILLDMGQQSMHIGNQTRIFSLVEGARSRLNTVYMIVFFLGGAAGSALSSAAWARWQWSGVCALGLLFLALAAVCLARGAARERRAKAAWS
jgi:predicted MFS family arabinose efflux permease